MEGARARRWVGVLVAAGLLCSLGAPRASAQEICGDVEDAVRRFFAAAMLPPEIFGSEARCKAACGRWRAGCMGLASSFFQCELRATSSRFSVAQAYCADIADKAVAAQCRHGTADERVDRIANQRQVQQSARGLCGDVALEDCGCQAL